MSQKKHSEMHLFIDETGKFTGDTKEPFRAVGGVLFFGRYDEATDLELLETLREELACQRGSFPEDLHYYQASLSPENMQKFLENLSGKVRALPGFFGVFMSHEMDVYHGRSNILREQAEDNRYVSMLEALIEYLVFVDPKVREQLADDWTLHLHIAERSVFANAYLENVENLKDLRAQGYRVSPIPNTGRKLVADHMVHGTLNGRVLQRILQGMLKNAWKHRSLNLGTIEIHSIQYRGSRNLSAAGFYLADLFLGQVRQRAIGKSPVHKSQVTLLTEFRALRYGPWLPLIADMGKALDQGNIEEYQSQRAEIEQYQPADDPALYDVLVDYDARIQQWFEKNPRYLMQALEEASKVVDQPGMTSLGYAHGYQAIQNLRKIGLSGVREELLFTQIALSHANHRGDVNEADEIWQSFQAAKNPFRPEHITRIAEIRNRRAVSLTDQFRYEEAREALIELITQTEDAAKKLAEFYQAEAAQTSFELGACYGTLGQIESFSGNYEEAIAFFKEALRHFEHKDDQLRQWIYLGHVACQIGGLQGRQLWQEVLRNVHSLADFHQATHSGSQFLVAVYMKSCLVFSRDFELKDDLDSWDRAGFFTRFSEEELRRHPFGLIYQTLAMSHARLAFADSVALAESVHFPRALAAFDRAAELMSQGGSLLKALALAATLRRQIFWLAVNPASEKRNVSLGKAFLAFRNHLQDHFGEAAWAEDETGMASGHFGKLDPGPGASWKERAEAVLTGIQFNYW